MKRASRPGRSTEETVQKDSCLVVDGEKYVDSGSGFLLQLEDEGKQTAEPETISADSSICKTCSCQFEQSYMLKNFAVELCDSCRGLEEIELITKSTAMDEYLLTSEDLSSRDPPLKFISKPNPHNVNWGTMKLYLRQQVESRAIEKWGSLEAIEEARLDRESKRLKRQEKQYKKKLNDTRKAVRSSLYKKETGRSHEHDFLTPKYDSDSDTFTKKCKTCGFVETFELM